jgi:pimeloyl-ACP methyl ester carboxylesterase
MSAEAGSPISTYFRVCDGVRVRFADTRADADSTVLLLAPWPETLWAFRRIWDRVSGVGRVVAIDLPGFGHSDGRPELIALDTSGAFLARLIDEWGLGAPHVVGPDVGTAAALFLAARAPARVTSLTVGGGAVRFPIDAGGALKDIIEAPSLDVVRGLDARTNIGSAVESGAASDSEPDVHEDYVSAYDLGRFAESARFVRHYPSKARSWVTCWRRSPRRPRSWPGARMTWCRGRTTSTSLTSSPTARSIRSTPVTSRGSKQPRNTAAWSSTGSAPGIGASPRANPSVSVIQELRLARLLISGRVPRWLFIGSNADRTRYPESPPDPSPGTPSCSPSRPASPRWSVLVMVRPRRRRAGSG